MSLKAVKKQEEQVVNPSWYLESRNYSVRTDCEKGSHMNWYTADLHFGHENVIQFDGRPFKNADEMDQTLIDNWNRTVSEEDDIFIIGDFCYRPQKSPDWYLKQLKGKKHLILGNHDGYLLKIPEAVKHFESIDKMLFLMEERERICLCHFPLAEWNGFYKGAWHIYGHIHNKRDDTYAFMKTRKKALNAGCMLNHYSPASFGQLIENNDRRV